MGRDATDEDLMQAANAAGFAMIGSDDIFDNKILGTGLARSVNVETAARGARLPAIQQPTPVASGVKDRVASSAQAVRDSVYGYLGLGHPA
jgi:hypothetical protein